ncbi:ThiF family adenylyltransferase [Corynebacterium caspium]|uniref:ThiF family adenylyltransferase n=1 Tax=Corynebacterium caspium TaxID=234828 RepID=UPI0003A20284|nr:ThiF family adenylyltransferase [Corynebacterium caspium]
MNKQQQEAQPLSAEQAWRYQRQLTLEGFGLEAQQQLLQAKVAVVGAGGLGSPALLYLAGAGVGEITVIDDDNVDLSNLHRQVIHSSTGVDTPKAASAAARLQDLNPTVTVRPVYKRLTKENAIEILRGADVILDGSDNFGTRHVVSWAAANLGIPHIWASILGFEAQMSVFWAAKGPIYEDLYPTVPPAGSVPTCSQAGVLGPLVGIVGSAMALEALKLLTGIGSPLLGKVGYFDSLQNRWEYIPLSADAQVSSRIIAAGPVVDPTETREADMVFGLFKKSAVPEIKASDISAADTLIDIREANEVAGFRIPGATHIAFSQLSEKDPKAWEKLRKILNKASGRVILYCASGRRSARCWEALQAEKLAGPGAKADIYSLAGGIQAWHSQKK